MGYTEAFKEQMVKLQASTTLTQGVSSPPRPLGSSPLPQHRPHPSYTPPDLVQIWVRRERCTVTRG